MQKTTSIHLFVLALSAFALLTATPVLAGKPEKSLVCHVGNETGPGGEVYLDDPECVPGEDNGYFCPDAGKIDLIVVAKARKHLENDSHSFDGISDYDPIAEGASGSGTEDTDGDGIDEGCEIPVACPCWEEFELQAVTAENMAEYSCSESSSYPYGAVLANEEVGFGAVHDQNYAGFYCATYIIDGNIYTDMNVEMEEADACIEQISDRCAVLGDPIKP